MGEELIQRNLLSAPEVMGDWKYYNIGATSLKTLKEAKLIRSKDYREFEKKKPDALIVSGPQVIAAIEYKTPANLRTDKQIESAIEQQIGTAGALEAHVYIVTDGRKTFWINPSTGNRYKFIDNSELALNFDKSDDECIKLLNSIIATSASGGDVLIDSPMVDPLPLAQKVWQDLWAVSGATPENCLYTFVELFIFKYLSDLKVLTGIHSFSNLLSQYETNSEEDVLENYANSIRVKIKELFPLNPKDNTTIINGTIFVSKDDKAVSGYATVFRKTLERFNSFGTLDRIDYDFKSKLFETFLKESISKKNWGQFFTPIKVVRAVVKMADVAPGMKVCDPFCGVGKFLLEPILHDVHKYYHVDNGQLKTKISLSGFDKGFDKDEQKTIILAKANMMIYLSALIQENPALTKQFSNLFNETFLLQTNSILGTLANPVTGTSSHCADCEDISICVDKSGVRCGYDLILTNPPYVMSGSSNLKDEISKQSSLKDYYATNAMGVEGLSMEWIVNSLKPGGKAFVIVPDGLMNRSNDKKMRDFIIEQCYIDAIISLPLNTFFTTNKKTYVMALTKKAPISKSGIKTVEPQKEPVFTYLCSEIGETRDAYRFDMKENDLDAAATLFNMFKGARSGFSSEDKRCKIVNIDKFVNGDHWSVERWWTHEEKIVLGIEDEVRTVTLDQLSVMIGDASSTLLEHQDIISGLQKEELNDCTMRYFLLSDVLIPVRGKSMYTKKYGEKNKGAYPVYSASSGAHLTKIDTFDFDGEFLSWATNGFAGRISVLSGKFSINGDRAILLPKVEGIDLHYLKFILQPVFRKMAKGRLGDRGANEFTKLYPSMIKGVKILFPIKSDGTFDLFAQQEIAKSYTAIEELRGEALEIMKNLQAQEVSL